MHSPGCVIAVERRLKEVPDIIAVRVKYPSGLAAITYQVEIDASRLEDAIKRDGYTLKVVGHD